MVSYSKFLKFLLSFSIALSPVMFINSANASTLAGGSGWRVASTVSNGIGVTVNGAKDVIVNGAKKTMTGVANVTPSASQVGKFIGKNAGAAAVIGAMDLLLDGVDWVIDEGGKVNKRPVETDVGPHHQYFWSYDLTTKFVTPTDALTSTCKKYQGSGFSGITNVWVSGDRAGATCNNSDGSSVGSGVQRNYNPTYDSSASPPATVPITDNEGKPLTLTSIGQMVINQAQEEIRTGNPAVPIATPVTQAAATAVVGEAATDETQARPITAELDKSAAIPTDETAVGEIAPPTTNPDTGEVKPGSISLDFPVFCSWAPSMCVLADKVQEAITDAREWVKESEQTETELEFPEQDQQETDTNINFNGSCPAKITLVNFNYHNNQQNWEVDFTDWCSAVTTYIKPIVISMGAFSAVLIVSGVRINE